MKTRGEGSCGKEERLREYAARGRGMECLEIEGVVKEGERWKVGEGREK